MIPHNMNMFGKKREHAGKALGVILGVVVIAGMIALYFPIWYQH